MGKGKEMTVQEQKEVFQTLRSTLEKAKGEIAKCMPSHMDANRLLRIALTVCNRNPKLMECHPVSIVACTMLSAELGLELSGPLGQCFMVPRFNKHTRRLEATFQVGYRGFMRLAFNTGKVSTFPMEVVHARDEFDISLGSNPHIHHKPLVGGDRGDAIGYYTIMNLLPTGQDMVYMSKHECIEHRKRFAPDNGIWDSDFDAMALKTTCRRLCKRAPVSTTIVKAAMIDEYEEQNIRAIPVGPDAMAGATRSKLTALKEKLAESGADSLLPDEIILDDESKPPAGESKPPAGESKPAVPESPAGPQLFNQQQQPANRITPHTAEQIGKLMTQLNWDQGKRNGFLLDWGTDNVAALTEEQGQEVAKTLLKVISGK